MLESLTDLCMEKQMCLASLHYELTREASETMLRVYGRILKELDTKPTEFFFIEIINMRRLEFLGRVLQIDSQAVEQYFRSSLELLDKHTSHEDAFSILRFLQDFIRFSYMFEFPSK